MFEIITTTILILFYTIMLLLFLLMIFDAIEKKGFWRIFFLFDRDILTLLIVAILGVFGSLIYLIGGGLNFMEKEAEKKYQVVNLSDYTLKTNAEIYKMFKLKDHKVEKGRCFKEEARDE